MRTPIAVAANTSRRQRPDHADELLNLRRPAGAVTLSEQPAAQPPVVVLERALVVVRTHLLIHPALGHVRERTGTKARRSLAHSRHLPGDGVQR